MGESAVNRWLAQLGMEKEAVLDYPLFVFYGGLDNTGLPLLRWYEYLSILGYCPVRLPFVYPYDLCTGFHPSTLLSLKENGKDVDEEW